MIVGPLLKLRDKLTNKRKSLVQDTEKPFLEHLEDLRKTVTRIVLTLLVAVIVCFVFTKWFFEIIREPLKIAGLHLPVERELPQSVKEMAEEEQQTAWWRIHGTARGLADLEGQQRDVFLAAAAKDDFTRQFAWAMLFYHVADTLPEEERAGYIAKAAALQSAADAPKIVEYAAQLTTAKTPPSLEKPTNFVEMEGFAPAEGFMLSMKLSMLAGVIVAFPLLFYFLLEFILPGLTGRERKLIFPALSIAFVLFLIGVLFAYFVVVPQALKYFHEYNYDLGIKDSWRIGLYTSFVTSFILIFGLIFETPVILMVMVKLGLLTSRVMRNSRGWAVIIILVAAAIITPTGDMFSMSMMAAPMLIMFEICIWLAWFHERRQAKKEAVEQRRDQSRRAALVGVAGVQASRPDDADASTASEPDSTPAALPYHSDHPEDSPSSGTHPHHPEESPDTVGDYEQYLRDHASLYTPEETHPESTPVEERAGMPSPEVPSADPDTTPAAETGGDIPSADPVEKKDDDAPPGPA